MKMNEPKSRIKPSITDYLWGNSYSLLLLIIVTAIMMFFMLDAKEIWTQEWRWANIAHQMMLKHDYFHPYLANKNYYDKPLLSYWMVVGLSRLIGHLNLWAIRLPNAIAGFITILCTYQLGKNLASKKTGLIAAWMLVSTFYFIFWSRVGSTDMLNAAGIMLAVLCYFQYRNHSGLFSYTLFFLILAVASLCKGLVAVVVTMIALLPDLLFQHNWKKHLNWKLLVGLIIGLILYTAPFIASLYFDQGHYEQNGLWLVFRENVLRYFQPFDHKGPIYTYFLYLPLYMFPWILLFIPAFFTAPFRWKSMPPGSRWFVWALFLIFLFFTASGSRRSYYVLPMIPFATLIAADWVRVGAEKQSRRNTIAGYTTLLFSLLLFLLFCIVYPVAYSTGGLKEFAKEVRYKASAIQPWSKWHIVMLDAKTKTSFYLNSTHLITFQDSVDNTKKKPNKENLEKSFPELFEPPKPNTILILRKSYMPHLTTLNLKEHYNIISSKPTLGNRIINPLLGKKDETAPVALIPKEIPTETEKKPEHKGITSEKKQEDKTSQKETNSKKKKEQPNESPSDHQEEQTSSQHTTPIEEKK